MNLFKLMAAAVVLGLSSQVFADDNHNNYRHRPEPVYNARFNDGMAYKHLASCGGYVELRGNGSQINLIFNHIQNCSSFDILSGDGNAVIYRNQRIAGRNGDRSASFAIPRSLYRYGYKGVHVVVKSNNNAHRNGSRDVYLDDFYIRFADR